MGKLYSLYRSPNIIRVIKSRELRWSGYVGRLEEDSSFKILKSSPPGKRPLGRPRRRREDSVRIDLKEIGINMMNSVHSAQDYWRVLVIAALNRRLHKPWN